MRWFNLNIVAADREKERVRLKSESKAPAGTDIEVPSAR